MVAGFALANQGYGFCGVKGFTEYIEEEGIWFGDYKVLVGKCSK